MNILIVEDTYWHQVILEKYIDLIIKDRYKNNIYIKENGQEALDFINYSKDKMDLIFTDVRMPIMDGVKFCEEFRKIDQETPIVMATCNYEKYNSDTIKTATLFTKKPYKFEEIHDIVEYYGGIIDHSRNRMAYK